MLWMTHSSARRWNSSSLNTLCSSLSKQGLYWHGCTSPVRPAPPWHAYQKGATHLGKHWDKLTPERPTKELQTFILSSDIPRNCEVRGGSPPPCSVSGMAPQASPTGQSQRVDVPSGLLLFACPLCSHKSKSRDTNTEGDVFFSVRTDRIIHDKC